MPFGGQGQHVKIDVLCRRQLNSEGSGEARNRRFLRRFSEGVKSAPWEALLEILLIFRVPLEAGRAPF